MSNLSRSYKDVELSYEKFDWLYKNFSELKKLRKNFAKKSLLDERLQTATEIKKALHPFINSIKTAFSQRDTALVKSILVDFREANPSLLQFYINAINLFAKNPLSKEENLAIYFYENFLIYLNILFENKQDWRLYKIFQFLFPKNSDKDTLLSYFQQDFHENKFSIEERNTFFILLNVFNIVDFFIKQLDVLSPNRHCKSVFNFNFYCRICGIIPSFKDHFIYSTKQSFLEIGKLLSNFSPDSKIYRHILLNFLIFPNFLSNLVKQDEEVCVPLLKHFLVFCNSLENLEKEKLDDLKALFSSLKSNYLLICNSIKQRFKKLYLNNVDFLFLKITVHHVANITLSILSDNKKKNNQLSVMQKVIENEQLAPLLFDTFDKNAFTFSLNNNLSKEKAYLFDFIVELENSVTRKFIQSAGKEDLNLYHFGSFSLFHKLCFFQINKTFSSTQQDYIGSALLSALFPALFFLYFFINVKDKALLSSVFSYTFKYYFKSLFNKMSWQFIFKCAFYSLSKVTNKSNATEPLTIDDVSELQNALETYNEDDLFQHFLSHFKQHDIDMSKLLPFFNYLPDSLQALEGTLDFFEALSVPKEFMLSMFLLYTHKSSSFCFLSDIAKQTNEREAFYEKLEAYFLKYPQLAQNVLPFYSTFIKEI